MSLTSPTSPSNISGQVVNISGQFVYTSGGGGSTSISGQSVVTSISGDVVRISGQTVDISQQTVITKPSGTLDGTNAWITVPSLSGGDSLSSNACNQVIIQNLPTNSGNIHVGVSGEAPHASRGLVLVPGASMSFDGITNQSELRCYATVSGERIATFRYNR